MPTEVLLKMRCVAISDTHSMEARISIPDGDLLIHAGDLLGAGRLQEIELFDQFLGSLPHRHKVIIAGNHDRPFENQAAQARNLIKNAIYLQDEAITIDGKLFYGSPWQPPPSGRKDLLGEYTTIYQHRVFRLHR